MRSDMSLLPEFRILAVFASVCRRNLICTCKFTSPGRRTACLLPSCLSHQGAACVFLPVASCLRSAPELKRECLASNRLSEQHDLEEHLPPSRTSPHSYALLSLTKLETIILPSRVVRNTRPTPCRLLVISSLLFPFLPTTVITGTLSRSPVRDSQHFIQPGSEETELPILCRENKLAEVLELNGTGKMIKNDLTNTTVSPTKNNTLEQKHPHGWCHFALPVKFEV